MQPQSTQIQELTRTKTDVAQHVLPSLLLYNDDVNTFDHVIHCLKKICAHTEEQATQAAFLVHHKGKCAVKSGTYLVLSPMCAALLTEGLSATITD